MSAANNDSQDVLCPEEAMSEVMLTAAAYLPSTGNEVIDGSAEDAACVHLTEDKKAYYHGPDVWPSQMQESMKK